MLIYFKKVVEKTGGLFTSSPRPRGRTTKATNKNKARDEDVTWSFYFRLQEGGERSAYVLACSKHRPHSLWQSLPLEFRVTDLCPLRFQLLQSTEGSRVQ